MNALDIICIVVAILATGAAVLAVVSRNIEQKRHQQALKGLSDRPGTGGGGAPELSGTQARGPYGADQQSDAPRPSQGAAGRDAQVTQEKFAHFMEQNRQLAREKEEGVESIRQLLTDLSVRTGEPMQNLQKLSEKLSAQASTDETKATAARIRDQIERVRRLLDGLVKMTGLEQGLVTFDRKGQPVLPMIDAVCRRTYPIAKEKNISFRYLADAKGLQEAARIPVLFDLPWTQEALQEIVENALLFTESGGTVTLELRYTEHMLYIDVADNGIGIPAAEQEKVFERFYRTPQAGHTEGIGIGLHLAKEIITGQGGTLTLTSAPGGGSTFYISLPLA